MLLVQFNSIFRQNNSLTLPLTKMWAVEMFHFCLTLHHPRYSVSVVLLSCSAALVLLARKAHTNCK